MGRRQRLRAEARRAQRGLHRFRVAHGCNHRPRIIRHHSRAPPHREPRARRLGRGAYARAVGRSRRLRRRALSWRGAGEDLRRRAGIPSAAVRRGTPPAHPSHAVPQDFAVVAVARAGADGGQAQGLALEKIGGEGARDGGARRRGADKNLRRARGQQGLRLPGEPRDDARARGKLPVQGDGGPASRDRRGRG